MSLILALLKYKLVVLFYSLLILFLYIFRNKFDREGSFVFLYRTKYGLKFMDYMSKKFSGFYKVFGFLGVILSFPGIILIVGLVFFMFYKSLLIPAKVSVAPVLPGLPIAGTGMVFPLITGWICLFIIIVIHESSHGILARLHNIKIKSSGIAFFGPLLAAFVEPDEKKLEKKGIWAQLDVYAAGPFSNIVTSLIFLLILTFIIIPPLNNVSGIESLIVSPQKDMPAWFSGMNSTTNIVSIDNASVSNYTHFINYTQSLIPNQTIKLTDINGKQYKITTTKNPKNSSKGYIGILFKNIITKPKTKALKIPYNILNWLKSFFFWLYFISINLGLINLFPIFITDGAKIVDVSLKKWIKNQKFASNLSKWINLSCLIVILLLLVLPLIRLALHI